jgi:cell division protein FtsL
MTPDQIKAIVQLSVMILITFILCAIGLVYIMTP